MKFFIHPFFLVANGLNRVISCIAVRNIMWWFEFKPEIPGNQRQSCGHSYWFGSFGF